ncbi:hypothetical protein [Sphaerisporangium rufum]|uniref:hypothetical protein n=1 Tax=Sphaerisporangium rufum TaxID=1381558 RepID=UPI00194FB7EF|nr:hypothetical protein [Sphaerisporangium rufum]
MARQVVLAQAALGFTVNSLGACLVLLARDLGTAPEELLWLSSSFGAGLLVVGLAGTVALRAGPQPALRAAALVTAAGAAVLATGATAAVAAAGALLLGLGAAGLVLVTPALLRGADAAAGLARANGAASVSALLGPVAIGGLAAAGVSGRLALLATVPPLLLLAAGARGGTPAPRDDGAARPRAWRVAGRWTAIVVAVSIEFCFTIWATARLLDAGLAAGAAAAAAAAFLAGMAAGRLGAPRLIGRGVPVVPLGCAVVVAGTVAVAVTTTPPPVIAGLVVAGLGVAPLYPVTLARLVQTPGLPPARSAAYGTLASGTAILAAPAALGALGAALDLRTAYLVAVLPLAAVLAAATMSIRWRAGGVSRWRCRPGGRFRR